MPEAPVLAAARLLGQRGVFGLVWLDADLSVSARYGKLVDFVEIGKPVTEQILPLIGLEDDIRSLRDVPGEVINLPAVSIVSSPDTVPRLNLLVLWDSSQQAYLLLVSRAITKADLEVELSREIRARLMTEATLVQKSRELARANQDLEEYAAIISHDLNAPLRAMRYLARDLEAALDTSSESAARQIAARLQEQSLRMSGMLSALLDYSSIGRKEEAVSTIDTLALVTAIIRSIPHPEGIRIELHGEWPTIATLAAPLDLVLRNLIGNAIAHHDRDTGLIRVIAIDAGGAIEITIADDGPGIPPPHHAAVFLPFRTLASPGQRSGHGMGLPLVKKTVESVNGAICLKSDPETARGASFLVTWPKRLQSHPPEIEGGVG